MPASAAIFENVRAMMTQGFSKLDLVTREEFDVQRCVLLRTREKIEELERQVAAATKGLARFETVKKSALLETELTVEGGELTPTMKLKRRVTIGARWPSSEVAASVSGIAWPQLRAR